jgi:DNA invertase Pin-like site-specific DNA recombinase
MNQCLAIVIIRGLRYTRGYKAATTKGRAMRFGYGRVSTRDQHTEAQHDALVAADVDPKNIYVEKASTRLAVRPELEKLRKILRPGDVLVVTKVDRLARSLLDLISIADDLRAQGIKLEVLTGTFNRDDPMGEAFFQMTGVFAQLERDMIRVRTNEGLEAARARGRTGGRKAKLTDAQANEVRKLYAAREKTVAEIGELFDISRESVYRYVKPAKQSA